jgi:hypothetical protein
MCCLILPFLVPKLLFGNALPRNSVSYCKTLHDALPSAPIRDSTSALATTQASEDWRKFRPFGREAAKRSVEEGVPKREFGNEGFPNGSFGTRDIVRMIRTKKIPFIQSTAAMPILLLTSAIMAIGIYLPFSSRAEIVSMERLPWGYFPWLIGFLLA